MENKLTKAYMNWSGGKDSALCLYHALQNKTYSVDALLTSVNAVHDRISMHGVRRSLLQQQAAEAGLPLTTIELPEQPSMEEYKQAMQQKVLELKADGFSQAIFGDIFLEDLKQYRVQQLAALQIECEFPLWKKDTTNLIKEFLQLGFKTIIVCVNEKFLDKSFCGRIIDEDFLSHLPAGVDPCGENGEFHSFVFDGPVFKNPISITKGDVVRKTYAAPAGNAEEKEYGFWFCDLLPG